jgi:hypothetical protein
VRDYPVGSEIAIDIGYSLEALDRRTCAIPWPIIVVSTHAATRVRDPGFSHIIAVPENFVVHRGISLAEILPQPMSAAVESEAVNARLPMQPRDEQSPDSLQRTVYNIQKPHFDNNSLKSFSTPVSTCPRIANTDLCSTIDSDCFGPTFSVCESNMPFVRTASLKNYPTR